MTSQELFEEWWEDSGQYLRSGGGNYEKTFAYHAWKKGRETLLRQIQEVKRGDYVGNIV